MTISAVVLKHSVSPEGKEIITFELQYPRFIHAELMTHRMFSRNAASSRAVPVPKMLEQILENPAMPVEWGVNKSGMQSTEVLSTEDIKKAEGFWLKAMKKAVTFSRELVKLKVHKQIANRITEPWSTMKVIVTATEWDNFYWLRDHEAAQPEFQVLAKAMHVAHKESVPNLVRDGEWHLPYITSHRDSSDSVVYTDNLGNELTLDNAIIISVSCCAQVSYRNLDDTLDKANKIYGQLMGGEIKHASPSEHQATPIISDRDQKGITHMSRDKKLWSGNFQGWIQFRQTLDGHCK